MSYQRKVELLNTAALLRAQARRLRANAQYSDSAQAREADLRAALECEHKATRMEAEADALPESLRGLVSLDLIGHLFRQREFSLKTFGPGERLDGILAHIRKELVEIEAKPRDVSEWIDVVLLALDGAWRAGHEPEAIALALAEKQAKNEARLWPDWRTAPVDGPIEHVRG